MTTEKTWSISDSLTFQELSKNEFETLRPPQSHGNTLNIAYGGYALAVACKAAALSVPEGYGIYSFIGNFLGPALIDRPLRASVRVLKETRAFATRLVELTQVWDNGEVRSCLIATADFQAPEKGAILEYERPLPGQYSHYSTLSSAQELNDQFLQGGKISKQEHSFVIDSFGASLGIFDIRECPEGIFGQNLFGVAKKLLTTQDNMPCHDRTTADWFRCRESLLSTVDHIATLAFCADGGVGLAPMGFNHLYFEDVLACTSLDFSMRFFTSDVDMGKFHLREIQTPVAAHGRAYAEMWIWSEDGKPVACMSQQCIIRLKPGKEKL